MQEHVVQFRLLLDTNPVSAPATNASNCLNSFQYNHAYIPQNRISMLILLQSTYKYMIVHVLAYAYTRYQQTKRKKQGQLNTESS